MKYCTSLVESSEDADWMVRMILQTGEEPRWITRVLRPIEVFAEELLLSIEVELAKKSMLFWARTRLLERLNCLSTRSSLGSNKVRLILPSIKTKKKENDIKLSRPWNNDQISMAIDQLPILKLLLWMITSPIHRDIEFRLNLFARMLIVRISDFLMRVWWYDIVMLSTRFAVATGLEIRFPLTTSFVFLRIAPSRWTGGENCLRAGVVVQSIRIGVSSRRTGELDRRAAQDDALGVTQWWLTAWWNRAVAFLDVVDTVR